MSSLQKPRKIGIYDTTGTLHAFLCKTKDEPRKDMRLLELCAMVNTLFKTDVECNRKRLNMKRYQITPLSEDSGMIEWMLGVKPLRHIVEEMWVKNGYSLAKPNHLKVVDEKFKSHQGVERANLFREEIIQNLPQIPNNSI